MQKSKITKLKYIRTLENSNIKYVRNRLDKMNCLMSVLLFTVMRQKRQDTLGCNESIQKKTDFIKHLWAVKPFKC